LVVVKVMGEVREVRIERREKQATKIFFCLTNLGKWR
jgi:hypothetical protein